MEQERLNHESEPRTAEDYWADQARDLVSLSDIPHSDPDYTMSYRLYVLAVCAAVEQDEANGAHGDRATMRNWRFHEGIHQAQQQIGGHQDEVSRFMAQDLSAKQWDEIISHDIGPNIRFMRRTSLPSSFLETLQALEAGDIMIIPTKRA